jgi:hypothetical protein
MKKLPRRFTPANPRFVWNIGSLREEYPDLPEQTETVDLIDRLTGQAVVSIARGWGNLFCLEHTDLGQPFTDLENWLNHLSKNSLRAEDLPA